MVFRVEAAVFSLSVFPCQYLAPDDGAPCFFGGMYLVVGCPVFGGRRGRDGNVLLRFSLCKSPGRVPLGFGAGRRRRFGSRSFGDVAAIRLALLSFGQGGRNGFGLWHDGWPGRVFLFRRTGQHGSESVASVQAGVSVEDAPDKSRQSVRMGYSSTRLYYISRPKLRK